MITLRQAKAQCLVCGRVFHQIDGTSARALDVVRAAVQQHIRDEHPEERSESQPVSDG